MKINRFYHEHFKDRYCYPVVAQIDKKDRKWLKRAARAAEQVDNKWRVGCVIVRAGRVLAVAANSPRNDPSVCGDRLWCSSTHAEAAALKMVSNPEGATAYVARIGRDGTWRHAQPCVRCQELLDEHGVDAIWTSDERYVLERQRKILLKDSMLSRPLPNHQIRYPN